VPYVCPDTSQYWLTPQQHTAILLPASVTNLTSPNQALPRTAPAVTLAAPPPSPTQPSRQRPPSLSFGR
jgi:hypothetical protein